MEKKSAFLGSLVLIFFVSSLPASGQSILIFAGAASKPPSEEIGRIFSKKSGMGVNFTFGGSGFVLSQMKLTRRGDIYFPGSSDFMEKAKKEKLVFPATEKRIAYLIPAINVQKGNPQRIRSIKDLLRPGLRLAIADPETVCVGTYAVEVIEKNLSPEENDLFRRNLVTMVESCEKTASIISLKAVDAVLGWEVFSKWDPDRIETIFLKPEEIPRIGYIPLAISVYAQDRLGAEQFIGFLQSSEGVAVFRKFGYLMSETEARKYTLPSTPVGGEYSLPEEWKRRERK